MLQILGEVAYFWLLWRVIPTVVTVILISLIISLPFCDKQNLSQAILKLGESHDPVAPLILPDVGEVILEIEGPMKVWKDLLKVLDSGQTNDEAEGSDCDKTEKDNCKGD